MVAMDYIVRVVLLLICLCITASAKKSEQCEVARMKCAYRIGCGTALNSYMIDCARLMAGRSTGCSSECQRALVALMSTDEGKALVDCDCHDSEFCVQSKERIEVCRPSVMRATAEDSVVSCSLAQWICTADSQCSTALHYYHRFCKLMFHGQKCTSRCNNSLAILNRQEKASKLRTCYCDGREDFPCRTVKENTDYLCYGRINEDNTISSSSCLRAANVILLTVLSIWRIVWPKPSG